MIKILNAICLISMPQSVCYFPDFIKMESYYDQIKFYGPSASKAIVVEGNTKEYEFCNLEKVLEEPGVQIRIFGKPSARKNRRMGV